MSPFVLWSLGAMALGAVIGAALVRFVNLAVARLWAIGLLLAVIVLFAWGMIRAADTGIVLVVIATAIVIPGLIGSVAGMVLTEWRMRKD